MTVIKMAIVIMVIVFANKGIEVLIVMKLMMIIPDYV